jgi:hypothetical protein
MSQLTSCWCDPHHLPWDPTHHPELKDHLIHKPLSFVDRFERLDR